MGRKKGNFNSFVANLKAIRLSDHPERPLKTTKVTTCIYSFANSPATSHSKQKDASSDHAEDGAAEPVRGARGVESQGVDDASMRQGSQSGM